MVMFIYRPEYYKIDVLEDGTPTHRLAELIIAKHRNGPTGDVKLKFIDTFARFEDFDSGSGDQSVEDVRAGMTTHSSRMNDMVDDEEPF
jgi:replicative DNA helicase